MRRVLLFVLIAFVACLGCSGGGGGTGTTSGGGPYIQPGVWTGRYCYVNNQGQGRFGSVSMQVGDVGAFSWTFTSEDGTGQFGSGQGFWRFHENEGYQYSGQTIFNGLGTTAILTLKVRSGVEIRYPTDNKGVPIYSSAEFPWVFGLSGGGASSITIHLRPPQQGT